MKLVGILCAMWMNFEFGVVNFMFVVLVKVVSVFEVRFDELFVVLL